MCLVLESWKFFRIFGIETVTELVVFWNALILWNAVIFGAELLLSVLKTTAQGRSLGGTIYVCMYVSMRYNKDRCFRLRHSWP